MNRIQWSYFDKFESVIDEYMEGIGEGETMASQIVTAVNKLIYKWYNDGDVFDNTGHLMGWWNDLSDYANWLFKNVPESAEILDGIYDCENAADYEYLLKDLADTLLKKDILSQYEGSEKVGTIYDCRGQYRYVE